MNLGERLRNIREDLDMTQQEVADLIPMNQSNYSKLERNIQQPSLPQLIRLAEIFNVTIDELLGIDSTQFVKDKITDLENKLELIYNEFFK